LQDGLARFGGAPSARLYETGVESPHPRTWKGSGASDLRKTSQGLIGVISSSEAYVSPEPKWDLRGRCLMLRLRFAFLPPRTVLSSQCFSFSHQKSID
jgi:hypothetical protein